MYGGGSEIGVINREGCTVESNGEIEVDISSSNLRRSRSSRIFKRVKVCLDEGAGTRRLCAGRVLIGSACVSQNSRVDTIVESRGTRVW
jgi:hypothetical protein